jgi:hypothetical protein
VVVGLDIVKAGLDLSEPFRKFSQEDYYLQCRPSTWLDRSYFRIEQAIPESTMLVQEATAEEISEKAVPARLGTVHPHSPYRTVPYILPLTVTLYSI